MDHVSSVGEAVSAAAETTREEEADRSLESSSPSGRAPAGGGFSFLCVPVSVRAMSQTTYMTSLPVRPQVCVCVCVCVCACMCQTSGVFQLLSVSLLSAVLLTVDFSLFHVLDIVSRHTFTQFNLTSKHTHTHTHTVASLTSPPRFSG